MRKTIATCLLGVAFACAAESPAVLDANGNLLGSYVGEAVDCGFGCPDSSVRIVSPTGYVFGLRMGDGTFAFATASFASPVATQIFYETENCSGQAYYPGGTALTGLTGGFVFQGRVGGRFYSPKSAISAMRTRASYTDDMSGCQDDPGNPQEPGIQILPNDPGVTGVTNGPIPGPLTIGQAVVPRTMFRDSFENPQAALAGERAMGVA